MEPDLERISKFDEKIREIAKNFGLDFFPQEFDAIPAQKMLEIMAYRFPVNFSHWSFGRDYERERTKYEHGFGLPYEVVLNSNPSRAYLMTTNPFPVQVMVMAHVYAHNDFMKNNFHFAPTRRDILPSASETAIRFQGYEKRYGQEDVERLIDNGLSIELNVDPDFAKNRFMAPKPVRPVKQMEAEGYIENWICYKSTTFSAKELTVLPGKTVTIKDSACYGFITMQGHGTMGQWDIETPALIRYGQLTYDEYFVSEQAAKEGVKITNLSKSDPIVLLKHFGPANPDLIID